MSIGRGLSLRPWPFSSAALLIAIRAATTAFIVFALLLPANAQFWGNSWGWRQQQPQQPYNPYGAAVKVVVMGDANADWLAYGLEDAFSEKPEIGIVRKHRTDSGLISYDARRDTDWPQVAREIIAVEKPKFIVMMIGNNDRQTIRERIPAPPPSGAPKANVQPMQRAPSAAPPSPPVRPDPEQQPPETVERHLHMTPEQTRTRGRLHMAAWCGQRRAGGA
jgi:hypothetical protein